MSKNKASVKVYHGYGHKENLVVYGHVFRKKAKTKQLFSEDVLTNLMHLFKLFKVKPFPFAKVKLYYENETFETTTAKDGFFKFEFASTNDVEAGWHPVKVEAVDDDNVVFAEGEGNIYVPHITQYGFISDIDDTIMISHSATVLKRLRQLFLKNPRTRKIFQSTKNHYQLLAQAHTNKNQPNPFFYVSSSEWNLYDYLAETFRFNGFPEGTFMLNQLKKIKDLVKTGKTGHEGKLLRIIRILDAFPNQRFVFFGDNSQQDPSIYNKIAERYAKNMVAVYIRDVRKSRTLATQNILANLELQNISTCLFKHSDEAIEHSKKIGLINW